ncbi:AAA family ATPase [Thermoproteota archaeon]
MWIEKYRPTNPNMIIGNEETRLDFIKWLKNWEKKEKPALILGPSGIGKTTLVHAVAKGFGYEVVELNASDARTKTMFEQRIGPSTLNTTLFGEKLLIFLDEVDGIYGNQDRGGVEFLLNLIKSSRNPIVMVANIEENKKMVKLVKSAQVFRFRRIPPKLLEMIVKNILRRENFTIDQKNLEMIVKNSNGDVRAAVNSAQVFSSGSDDFISEIRDTQISPIESLKIFFNASSKKEAYIALTGCKMQPREKIRVIFQSILSSGLEGEKLIEVMEEISKADEVIANIDRTKNWILLRYFDQILAGSLFNALQGVNVRYGIQSVPWNLQIRLWNDRIHLKYISSHLAKQHHVSTNDIVLFYLPYIALLSRLKNYEKHFVDRLRLDESALKILRKETKRVILEAGTI